MRNAPVGDVGCLLANAMEFLDLGRKTDLVGWLGKGVFGP